MRLESDQDGDDIVHRYSESSLVVKVKSKQHLDLALMNFKESVLEKSNLSFSLGGNGVLKVPRKIMCSR